jgi:SAM-dependent methyltransferase
MSLAIGKCRVRSKETLRIDDPNADLSAICRFSDLVDRYLGARTIALDFLAGASTRWNGPVSILDLGCAQGSLSRALVNWGRSHGQDVRVHGSDPNPRLIHMAREANRDMTDLTFECRTLDDPFYLQAQQFDYVISTGGFHRQPDERTELFLKTANRLAKRGVIVIDWLRDARARFYLSTLARFAGDLSVREEMALSIMKGFSIKEADALRDAAGLGFAQTRTHMGYRFSIGGERALVVGRQLAPGIGLAGA